MLVDLDRPVADLRPLLGRHCSSQLDPTARISTTAFRRGVRTPDGPGGLSLVLRDRTMVEAHAYGQGGDWLLATVPALLGLNDIVPEIVSAHAAVTDALTRCEVPRMSASSVVFPGLINAILGQRVTAGEAVTQWATLCRWFNEPAPGLEGVLLPPPPTSLATVPTWTFHRAGIDRHRADTIIEASRRADRLQEAATMSSADAYQRLTAVRRIGPWTAAAVLSAALGDPDAVQFGDFHLKNIISFALAGEPRGTDERMAELLVPYAGQRGRIVELLQRAGWAAPKCGPRQPIQSIAKL